MNSSRNRIIILGNRNCIIKIDNLLVIINTYNNNNLNLYPKMIDGIEIVIFITMNNME